MAKSPAFQFYVNDFLGSAKVGSMNGSEVGIYLMLLFLDWQEIGFEFNPDFLSRWCRVTRGTFLKAWVIVSKCFEERDGRMFNHRLDIERKKQAEWSQKSRNGGLTSGQVRRKGGSTTFQPSLNTPSPSSTPTPNHPSPPYPDEFEKTWVVYPKREGGSNKSAAYRAWRSRIKQGVTAEQMHAGTLRYANFVEAKGKVGTEYVKLAATFFGPDRHFDQPWDFPGSRPEPELEIEG